MIIRRCLECGDGFAAKRSDNVFCGRDCKTVFNNRRNVRGAAMYDLVMEMRFDRKQAADRNTWTQLCDMAGKFRAEDRAMREGRRSWSSSQRLMIPAPGL